MWKELQQSPPYFLNFIKKCSYEIFITDYIKIWSVSYTEEEFIKCLKDSNYHLEIDTYELIDKGIEILLKPMDLRSLKIIQNQSILSVILTKLYEYPFHLKIELVEGSNELFFQKVTQPLLKTVKDLKCSQQELRRILIKKDEEIEEYKSLGSKIRYTVLPPYSDEVHMEKHCTYENNFGDMEIPDEILKKIVVVTRENILKDEAFGNKSMKQEPLSQEMNIKNEHSINEGNQYNGLETIKTECKPIIPVRPKRKKTLNL